MALTSGHMALTSGHLALTSGHMAFTSGHMAFTPGRRELYCGFRPRRTKCIQSPLRQVEDHAPSSSRHCRPVVPFRARRPSRPSPQVGTDSAAHFSSPRASRAGAHSRGASAPVSALPVVGRGILAHQHDGRADQRRRLGAIHDRGDRNARIVSLLEQLVGDDGHDRGVPGGSRIHGDS